MLAIILLVVGIISRFFIHVPNFTPVIAIALFSGVYLKRKHAIFLPLALMIISDMMIGMHNMVFFTWGSIIFIALMGLHARKEKSVKNVFMHGLLSALIFFVVTNFGVWLASGMYSMTLPGLIDCFVMAIPFFRNTLASTLVYSVVMFTLYELIALKLRNTRFATAL